MPRDDVKQLWGQEFKLTKPGLAEDQIIPFVNNLISQRDSLTERQQHLASLQMLAEKTVREASEMAERIKQEAKNEIAGITAEAEEKAREIIADGQRQAVKAVSDANKIVRNIKQEAQNQATRVISEAQENAHEIGKEAEKQAERIAREADATAENTRQEAQARAAAIVAAAHDKAHDEVENILERTRQEAATLIDSIKKQVSLEIQASHEELLSRLQDLIASAEAGETRENAKYNTRGGQPRKDKTVPADHLVVEGNKGDSGSSLLNALEPEPVAFPTGSEGKGARRTPPGAPALSAEEAMLFEGETEIAIRPPVDSSQVVRLSRQLQDIWHLKIVRTAGSWKEGKVITAVSEEPAPVLGILAKMPEVEKAKLWAGGEEGSDDYFPWWLSVERKPGGLHGNRMVLTMKKVTKPN